jgi:uncharacterized membrane protein
MKPIKTFFSRLLLVLAATVCSCPAFAAYDFVSIDYPGAVQTDAFGINNAGTVVGNGYDVNFNQIAGYSYDSKKGSFTTLTPVPGSLETLANGINEPGEIVGFLTFDGVTALAYVRSKKGVYTTFSHPGSSDTEARAKNNNGLVTGLYIDDNTGNLVGFIYDTGKNTFTDIFLGPGGTIAQGINNKGEVVGGADLDAGVACTGCLAGIYGWLRAPNGAFSFFQVNGTGTQARGITDSGVITGFIDTGEGFVVTLAGSSSYQSFAIPAAELLVVPGAVATSPEAISNKGTVVGSWFDAAGLEHGFIATP